MRRVILLAAVLTAVTAQPAKAGPGSASGPITVDSTTFVPGTSVMGTDGGVYGDNIPPVTSTTTAALRMTRYRALHVNLRDSAGAELGTNANPLVTASTITVTLSTVTIINSSFSVTGSTVTVSQPTAANLNATVVQGTSANLRASVSISGSSNTVSAAQSGTWNVNSTSVNVSTVTFNGTPDVAVTNNPTLGSGTNNIGTVTGSSITIPGTVNTKQVNISTVIVQSMPPVSVTLSTVTITNSTFSIVGITSVTVMNPTLTVQLTGATPAGGNNIGTVSGSSVTVTNGNITATVAGTPNVNVLAMPNVAQTTPASLRSSVYISGSSNTVQAAQSGTWSDTVTQVTPANLQASVSVNGSSNTVQATQSTAASLRASVSISGSSNTVSQGGAPWSQNITQIAGNAITGSSMPVTGTLAATQSGTWTATVTQGTPASLQSSVSINGSSNTVAAAQSGTWSVNATPVGTSTVTFNGVSQPVTATVSGTPTVYVTNPTTATVSGSVSITGTPNVYVTNPTTATVSGTVAATQSGTWTNTVNQGTARWNMSFSTTTTTAVLSSTGVTTNVAISTPVAGVSSQTVRIFRLVLSVDAATTITFRDGSTNFGDSFYMTANGALVLDLSNEPWYITSATNGFVIKQSGSANIGVRIWYTQS